MQPEDASRMNGFASVSAPCFECEGPASDELLSRAGNRLCAGCAAAYYTGCESCRGFVARDEALSRDGLPYCPACFAQAGLAPGADVPDDAEVESLVTEYVSLQAEHKRLGERLGEIKERLKLAASVRQRVADAVILRSTEGGIRCRYSVKINCDDEKVAALEGAIGRDLFASLFERKVTFSAVKKNLEELLSSADQEREALREAVRDAVERIEVPTVTVVRPPGR